ncbi:MAG TPA: pyruvate:ferredoxin (flavodoxin) oxidoreductase [Victivallales bacterium]|nr:pyruvate:ferredoxin (flavodoxin) oxidoreductase [Victivallales bacterium]HRR27832.1 pyruvate:ferredoxin (flavodoxin) oxidoreductase [Victivallales bacterium]
MPGKMVTIDGNTAAAHVAYALSEVAAIYPITPSSNMGEYVDEWSAKGRKNIFGLPVNVVEMQSEAGAAGAVHGSLTAGALTTTFTASQGLLLMIPNMHKIAGEMLPTVFHVSARSLACQSLSIFGDHSDVMSVRNTGFALIASASVQEVMDLALVAHLSTLKSKIPFLHFFDGFRTSHEVQKVHQISYEEIASLVEHKYIEEFRKRAIRPDAPFLKVGAQNPDVYFQGRETVNKYYAECPTIVKEYMEKVFAITGRKYKLFDYIGAPDAKKVIVAMGSACSTIEETVNYLVSKGKKVGAVFVRLYRPFSVEDFKAVLPKTVKKIAVLDRTKEPGAIGEPLYLDVVSALKGEKIKIIGGRYGLSSKEFTPSMVNAVYEHLDKAAFHGFTVGIEDDVTKLSIPVTKKINTEPSDVVRCMFWGLGSDGTVGANKNSIKIIGDNTDMYAQGYFVYDSKKSYGITISHLRFGKSQIKSAYLIDSPNFVACHNPAYIGRYDMLNGITEGGVFLLNSEWNNEEIFKHLTKDMQQIIKKKKIKFYNIDALKISTECGLGARINTVMMTAFFLISGVLEKDKAMQLIKDAIKKTYAAKGEDIVKMNWLCVDKTAEALQEVKIPDKITEYYEAPKLIPEDADNFAKKIVEPLMHLKGDNIPVSLMSFDGTIPTGTAALEKRGIAPRVPKWIPEACIQCNMCVMSCPHAVIRAKQILPEESTKAPSTFKTVKSKCKNDKNLDYRIQIYVDDCTGCGVCVETCPAKPNKALEFTTLEEERANGQVENYKFFEKLQDNILDGAPEETLKGLMFKKPLFEFSGACAGCGETPYVKILTQLCGENLIIANATGCSSIYGGTFPTTPYCKTKDGRGPAWANSLFEDNAEYGFGMRLAVENNRKQLKLNVEKLLEIGGINQDITAALKHSLSLWDKKNSEAIIAQNAIKILLPKAINEANGEQKSILAKIAELSDYFVDKSIWCIGGDGWAYDIGFGGLDHVVAMNKNIKILVLDTEVYSNTGGQASKSTPIAAVAKFANSGMRLTKKNLGFMCMTYGYVYVASVAMGANRVQTINAFREAEEYNGPSIIIAYAPCIAHGIDMMKSQTEEKRAVEAGYWPLYRYNPAKILKGESPFIWDSKDAQISYQEFIKGERRYTALLKTAPQEAEKLFQEAENDAKRRMEFFKKLGSIM